MEFPRLVRRASVIGRGVADDGPAVVGQHRPAPEKVTDPLPTARSPRPSPSHPRYPGLKLVDFRPGAVQTTTRPHAPPVPAVITATRLPSAASCAICPRVENTACGPPGKRPPPDPR